MFALENHYLGDSWYFVAGDTAHMFFLAFPLEREGRWDIGHAISQDLINWEYVGVALEPGPEGAWDGHTLATGSVMEWGGRYWMAFTGCEDEGFRTQRVGMAVSDDLIQWEKVPENPRTQAEPPHYEQIGTGKREMIHWRDPFLFEHGDAAYQFVCARRSDGEVTTRGTVAVARSTDMVNWDILGPLEHDRIAEEMEVPQLYHIDGRWYLVFCTPGSLLAPSFARSFAEGAPGRGNFSLVGSSPLGPFHVHGTGLMVHRENDEYFYAAQLVNLRDKWHLMATVDDGDNHKISDPVAVYADETGIHAEE